MHKILILASGRSVKKGLFVSYLKNYFGKRAEIVFGVFSEITFSIKQNEVLVEVNGVDIKDFNLIYFRNTFGSQPVAATLALYLNTLGIKFFDRSLLGGSAFGDKFTALMKLAINNVPIVPSYYCSVKALQKNKKEIVDLLGLPVVAKEVTTQRMESVYLLKSLKDFNDLPKNKKKGSIAKYLFQKFIAIDKEYRAVVLGDTVGVVHTKTVRDNTGFQIGYSDINEYPVFMDKSEISQNMRDASIKAAMALDVQIAGVDICSVKESDKIYVIEVNRGPGFEYDTNVSPELLEVSKFFEREILKK